VALSSIEGLFFDRSALPSVSPISPPGWVSSNVPHSPGARRSGNGRGRGRRRCRRTNRKMARSSRNRGDRYQLPSPSPAARAIDDFILLEDEPRDSAVHRLTKGRGAKVVFDAVGGPRFEPALRSLAHRGRQVEITSAIDRRFSFDLLDFYHNESRLLGVDTRKRDATASAAVLERSRHFSRAGPSKPPWSIA
jgi:hypothetical protein